MSTTVPAPDAGFRLSSIAAAAIAAEPLCADCLSREGLCLAHAKSVLPQLAQPHWYRLVGSVLAPDRAVKDEAPAVLKAKRRTARRLQRAMAGEFTRTRSAA